MKTKNMLLTLIIPAMLMVGCAEEKKKKSSTNTGGGVIVDVCNPAVEDCNGVVNPCLTTDCNVVAGTAVTVTNISLSAYRSLRKNTSLNSSSIPTDMKFALDVYKAGQGFAGDMAISFTANNQKITMGGTTILSSNAYSDTAIAEDSKYNVQFANGTWHGFFDGREPVLGYANTAITIRNFIVVVDAIEGGSEGDGAPLTGRGSIWFRNTPNNPEYCYNPPYGISYDAYYASCGAAYLSPTVCWKVSLGPNDCRTWKNGNDVNTFQALYPGSEYTKLGNFSGLNLSTSFNGDFAY